MGLQFAAQVVVEDLHPGAFGLADHRGDPTTVEKRTRVRVAADVKAPHQHREARGDELQRQVPAARVLIGLHAGEAD